MTIREKGERKIKAIQAPLNVKQTVKVATRRRATRELIAITSPTERPPELGAHRLASDLPQLPSRSLFLRLG